jgi:hypothetical protein
MTAVRQQPAPQPQPMHTVALPTRDAKVIPPAATTHDPPREDHAEEPGYGHGV